MSAQHKKSIDTTRYVAIGDSITAGYADGALYFEAQQFAYPNILSEQFNPGMKKTFRLPLMDQNSVGVGSAGNARLVLKRASEHAKDLFLSPLQPRGDVEAFFTSCYSAQGPFDNLGVPGAKVAGIRTPGYGNHQNGAGNYNPFFSRMASNSQTASVLSDALANNPTFFSLFIGNNDALGYALSGGTTDNITSPEQFEQSVIAIINTLTANGAQGVIASLPDIQFIPYFTSIPYDGLLLDSANASFLNARYAGHGLSFREGKNAFIVQDPESGLRQMQPGEFILLDLLLDKNKFRYLQAVLPIPKTYTLSHKQIVTITQAIEAYNVSLKNIAQQKDLAFVDIHTLIKAAKPDRFYNPVSLNLDYKRKGVFSLDGLHPNAFGQALIANAFIKAINHHFGTHFHAVKSGLYPGIHFPLFD